MDDVESLGVVRGQAQQPHRRDLEALVLDPGDDAADHVFLTASA